MDLYGPASASPHCGGDGEARDQDCVAGPVRVETYGKMKDTTRLPSVARNKHPASGLLRDAVKWVSGRKVTPIGTEQEQDEASQESNRTASLNKNRVLPYEKAPLIKVGAPMKFSNQVESKKKQSKQLNKLDRLPSCVDLARGSQGPTIMFRAASSISFRAPAVDEALAIKQPNHVTDCTCPQCRKAKRANKNKPVVLKYKASLPLIDATMEFNGFQKTNKEDWNVLWVSNAIKQTLYLTLRNSQKVNQFPRTYEITRKDELCRNMNRMMQVHGKRHFDFYPQTFVLPEQRNEFEEQVRKKLNTIATEALYSNSVKGEKQALWIVKPAAKACGRGIYVTDNPGDVPLGGMEDSNVTVSEYIANPLLMDGRKFDLRIYAAVTGFNPVQIYVYKEGLVRLATIQYSADAESLHNNLVHLTNYSVQKSSDTFQAPQLDDSTDQEGSEKSSKWSLKTFFSRLARMGINSEELFAKIESIIVKTIISIEPQVSLAMGMSCRHPNSCFQLFGFDILLDAELKPWLLEVNLGPSLSCDHELDFVIKRQMIADLLSLAGVQPVHVSEHGSEDGSHVPRPIAAAPVDGFVDAATVEKAVRALKEAQARAGGWKCIYPTSESFVYDRFFEKKGINQQVVQALCGNRSQSDKNRVARRLKL